MLVKQFGLCAGYAKHIVLLSLFVGVHCLAQDEPTASGEPTRRLADLRDSHKRLSDLAAFYWIDEHRILFEALNGQEVIRPDGYKVLLQSLFLWDTNSGQITDKGEIGGGLCYSKGYVRYRNWNTEKRGTELGDIVAGPLDGVVRPQPSLAGIAIDLRTCHPRTESPSLPDWTAGKSVRRLSDHVGFFVLGPAMEGRNTPVTYHPKGNVEGVLMPFKRREARFGSVEYFAFKHAYFIEGDYFVSVPQHPDGGYNKIPWPRGVLLPAWWLYPDGRVVDVELPSAAREASWLFPGKNGFYFVSHRFPTRDGLYQVVDSGTVVRILKGSITRYSVSPSGCSIAVNHDGDYHGTRGRGTLKTVKVCSSGD